MAGTLHLLGRRRDVTLRQSTLTPLPCGRILTTSIPSLKEKGLLDTNPAPAVGSEESHPVRCWMVERTLRGTTPLRRLLVRQERNLQNDKAVPHLALVPIPDRLVAVVWIGFSCRRCCRKNSMMAFVGSLTVTGRTGANFQIQPQTGSLQQNRHYRTVMGRGRSWAGRPLHLV